LLRIWVRVAELRDWNDYGSIRAGGIMATTASTKSWKSIGLYVQIAGGGAFLAGVALSLEHVAIAVCFIAGAAAFFVGKKLKAD
jgi:hypothetical protein